MIVEKSAEGPLGKMTWITIAYDESNDKCGMARSRDSAVVVTEATCPCRTERRGARNGSALYRTGMTLDEYHYTERTYLGDMPS